jgi:hypothetical protein
MHNVFGEYFSFVRSEEIPGDGVRMGWEVMEEGK